MYQIVKSFPLTLCCIAGILTLCLIPIPETPLSDVPLIDKWTHMAFYAALLLIFWAEYGLSRYRKGSFLLVAATLLAAMALGGLIELLQAYATTCRSGEWLDFWADSIGAVAGTVIGRWAIMPATRHYAQRRRAKS